MKRSRRGTACEERHTMTSREEDKMTTTHITQATPASQAIFIAASDYERLTAMAEGAANREPELAAFLLGELERASTDVPAANARVVAMGSHVRFRDEDSGRIIDAQLVYPDRADPVARRISILTPVGAALIGLSEGQAIQWRDRGGKDKTLTVLKVQDEMQLA
jgi:regulator of nucleoside diphosphate kinase